MNAWMIAAIVFLLTAVVLGILLAMEMRNGELRTRQLENDNRALQRQASRLKTGEQRRQEEMTLLKRELALQLDKAAQMEQEGGERAERYREVVERAQREEKRRMQAERELNAMRMREEQLEQQREALSHEKATLIVERREQQHMYEEIIRENEDTIVRLQSQNQKRKRKIDVLEDQVTLNDLLGTETKKQG